jgi:glycine oxidase
MNANADVLILGGGVIGLSIGFFLAEEGLSVSLLDREDLGRQASWAGAGIIPPGNPARASSPPELIRARSSQMFPELSARLRELTGIDNGYRVSGGLEIPEPGDLSGLPTEEWLGEGITFAELDRRGIDSVEPDLAPHVKRAFHLPGMAQVRNPRHLQALVAACAARKVRLLPHCPAQKFHSRGSKVTGLETPEGVLTANLYLIAAGAWTPELLRDLSWQPPVAPVKGQICLLQTDTPGPRPILLQGKRYLVPRGDGLVLVGATEEDAGFDPRPTADGVSGLLLFASELLPALKGAHVEKCWAGLRPGSPDGQPFLGRVPEFENLFVAAGHFRAGIQLSPITALLMSQLMLGRPLEMPLEAFRPDRPSAPPG